MSTSMSPLFSLSGVNEYLFDLEEWSEHPQKTLLYQVMNQCDLYPVEDRTGGTEWYYRADELKRVMGATEFRKMECVVPQLIVMA